MKKIQDIDCGGKKILLRADFNVEVENGDVKEKFKIKAIKETLDYLLKNGARVAVLSHLGRPENKEEEFSLSQIADDAERILSVKIKFISDCVGEKVKDGLENLGVGEALLLENVRFYGEDEKNDKVFAEKLAENFDIFVNDAFSVCHRNQSSVTGVADILSSYAGFTVQREVKNLTEAKDSPASPSVAIIGGAKIETKLSLIKKFEENYDHILIGGKIANEAIDQKLSFSEKVSMPGDFAENRLDIGPATIEEYKKIIASAKTIVWNGPLGQFEIPPYDTGTREILSAVVSNTEAFSLLGGGETVQMLEESDLLDKISFVSTGGGAMLAFLAGESLPGLEALA